MTHLSDFNLPPFEPCGRKEPFKKPGKAESPFFGGKKGTQLLVFLCLVGVSILGSMPLGRHFGNLADTLPVACGVLEHRTAKVRDVIT